VAGLQARSPLRSAHPLLFVNKIVSLTAFIFLLGAGWVALSYLKTDVFDRWQSRSSENSQEVRTAAAGQAAVPEVKPLVPDTRLVYSCTSDKDYYHASSHLPAGCERTVLSEEAAIGRSLKRCKTCFPD
jgi:hypothetical protein